MRLTRFLRRLLTERSWPEGSYRQQLDAFARLPDAQKDERVQKVTRIDRYKARHAADQQRRRTVA